MKIKFRLNGKENSLDVIGNERLIDILREKLGLVGTKEGCGKGECGACTILFDDAPICSCLILSSQIAGHEIVTIEGLSQDDRPHPVQEAFAETGAVQCGFCSPGMVLSAVSLLKRNGNPSRQEIKQALSGNLCRCTGYEKIIDAVELASNKSSRKTRHA
jgi:aerobic carbon-monoxide dehydrogenase small subunit